MSLRKYIKKPVTKSHINPYLFLLLKRVIELEAVLHEAIISNKNNGQVPVTDKRKKPIISGIKPPITVVLKFVFERTNASKQGESLVEFVRKSWSSRNFYFESWQLTEIIKLTKLVVTYKTWEEFAYQEERCAGGRFGETFVGLPYQKVWFSQKVTLEMMAEERITNFFIHFINRVFMKENNIGVWTKSYVDFKNEDIPSSLPKGLEEIVRLPQYKQFFPSEEQIEFSKRQTPRAE